MLWRQSSATADSRRNRRRGARQKQCAADALSELARECWERGGELPSLALRKLFEKPNEAYHDWNASLPGYVKPHEELGAPFSSTEEFEENFACAQEIREKLRHEMIARQEEMDWLVYAAYGLIDETDPAVQPTHRRCRSYARSRRASVSAVRRKPTAILEKPLRSSRPRWSANKKKLWRARLEAIRDNEHIRRIEQPIYKRRWDEQWKVGNRWECGRSHTRRN